jgi:hypothetical protein
MVMWFSVLPTVGFNGNPKCRTCEIEQKWRHRVLAAKVPAEGIASQSRPESALGLGRKLACGARHLDFMSHGNTPS